MRRSSRGLRSRTDAKEARVSHRRTMWVTRSGSLHRVLTGTPWIAIKRAADVADPRDRVGRWHR